MTTAAALAERFAVDRDRVRLAAIAHDMDRDRSAAYLLGVVSDWEIPVTLFERKTPNLLHGPVAAQRLRREFRLDDRGILYAVRHHTLGHPILADRTDPLGLILYIADYCEPGRSKPGKATRHAILEVDNVFLMAQRVVESSQQVFGRLDDSTARLYARLDGDRNVGTKTV